MIEKKIILSKKKLEKMKRDSSLTQEYNELIANGSMVLSTLEFLGKKYKLKPSSVRYIVAGYDRRYGRYKTN